MIEIASIIFENDRNELLLYLRDNNPAIPWPHHWDLFGGHIEQGETPEQALKREIKEELGIELNDFHFFKKYEVLEGDDVPNTKYIFHGKIAIPAQELTLHEGERLQFFPKHELKNLRFAGVLNNIVLEYCNQR